MPPVQEQQNPSPTTMSTPPVSSHSAWFYIGWTIAVIIFVPVLVVAGRFAYIEFQLTQARQEARTAAQQAQEKFQEMQDIINASEAPTQGVSNTSSTNTP